MNLLFLDVDGPLLPIGKLPDIEFGVYKYKQSSRDIVDNLCQQFDLKIIFNSMHNTYGQLVLQKTLEMNGLGEYGHTNIVTEYPFYGVDIIDRETAILNAVRYHKPDKWISFDDLKLNLEFTIQTPIYGISQENYLTAIRILERNK